MIGLPLTSDRAKAFTRRLHLRHDSQRARLDADVQPDRGTRPLGHRELHPRAAGQDPGRDRADRPVGKPGETGTTLPGVTRTGADAPRALLQGNRHPRPACRSTRRSTPSSACRADTTKPRRDDREPRIRRHVPTRDELLAADEQAAAEVAHHREPRARPGWRRSVRRRARSLAPDRAWHACTSTGCSSPALSSGGVTIVAVQRITTARWSRPVVRMLEGYVAFLPVAFVFLLIMICSPARGTSSRGANGSSIRTRRRRIYFSATFLTIRDIVVFGAPRR